MATTDSRTSAEYIFTTLHAPSNFHICMAWGTVLQQEVTARHGGSMEKVVVKF